MVIGRGPKLAQPGLLGKFLAELVGPILPFLEPPALNVPLPVTTRNMANKKSTHLKTHTCKVNLA